MAHLAPHTTAPQQSEPFGGGAFWRLIAPALGYVFLGIVAITGLFSASAAQDGADYNFGLFLFAVAAIAIVLRMRAELSGRSVGFLSAGDVGKPEVLAVTIAVLLVVGLIGAAASAAAGSADNGVGLAVFVICALLIFVEIKRYFDHLEGH